MTFDRKRGGHIDIVDPDNPTEQDPITGMLSLNDEMLLIFKTKGVYEVIMASQIDPDNKHPETRNTYQKLFSVGSSNSFLARMIIQFSEVIDQLKILDPKNINLNDLKKYVWESNKLLLECEKSYFAVYDKTMAQLKKADDIVEANKIKGHIPTLPVIEGLNEHCFSFFSNGKRFLINSFCLLEKFFNKPSHGANFQKSFEWVREKFGDKHPITQMLSDDIGWVRLLSECRNAIEHPSEGLSTKFDGFKLRAGNKVSAPTWTYDLKNVGLGSEDDVDLIRNLDVFQGNMLTLFEELMLLCIEEIHGFKDIFAISKIPDEKIDKNRVIKYRLVVKADWLAGLQELRKKP